MFNLSLKHAVNRHILRCDYIRYTPPSLDVVNGENNQMFVDLPREDSTKWLKYSYLEEAFNAGAHARCVDNDHIS